MNGFSTLLSLSRKLDLVEAEVQNCELKLILQGEALQNQISRLERVVKGQLAGEALQDQIELSNAQAQEGLKVVPSSQAEANSGRPVEELTVTPAIKGEAPATTVDRLDAAAVQRTEQHVSNLDRVNESILHATAARSDTVLEVLEERLEKLEKAQEQPPRNANIAASSKSKTSDLNEDITTPSAAILDTLMRRATGTPLTRTPKPRVGEEVEMVAISSQANWQTLLKRRMCYEWQESVYDAAFFTFSTGFTTSMNVVIFVSIVINLCLQCGMCLILRSDQFTKRPFGPMVQDRINTWRTESGHWLYTADEISGTSLAARLCNGDDALSFANSQMVMFEQVSQFMDNGQGLILLNLATALWFFCCCAEIRSALMFAIAICTLPRGTPRSVFHADEVGISVLSLSLVRLVWGVFGVAAVRVLVAAALLYYGCNWLSYTSSILELLLNASALGFVLDIDEIIYSVLSPLMVKGLISSLYPLRLPGQRALLLLPFAAFAFCAAFLIGLNLTFQRGMGGDMDSIKQSLCSGNQNLDFIVGTNALGWVTYARTVPWEESVKSVQSPVSARASVTKLLIDGNLEEASKYITNLSTTPINRPIALLREADRKTLESLVANTACMDIHWNPKARYDATIGAHLWTATGEEKLRNITTCAEVSRYCRLSNTSLLGQNARFMCPITCGCASPSSGLWKLHQSQAGCPAPKCQEVLMEEVKSTHYQCEDTTLTYLNSTGNWSGMLGEMYSYGAITIPMLNNLTLMGCEALGYLNESKRVQLCDLTEGLLGTIPVLGASFLCPVSCGCPAVNYDHGIICPEACMPSRNDSMHPRLI